jgi:hypothetical protein
MLGRRRRPAPGWTCASGGRRGATGRRGGEGAADEVAPAGLGLAEDGAHAVLVEEILRRLADPARAGRSGVGFGHDGPQRWDAIA